MIEWLSEQKEAEGIYNCVAPNAVTNKTFMQTMNNYKQRNWAACACLAIGNWSMVD
jgi:NAD dependent epimerase/dehydratase family enzyme